MSCDKFDLRGRIAIVTGGGTGIGAATARVLADRGADVVIASRTTQELEKTATAIRDATKRRCLAVPTDVKDGDHALGRHPAPVRYRRLRNANFAGELSYTACRIDGMSKARIAQLDLPSLVPKRLFLTIRLTIQRLDLGVEPVN